MATRDLRSYFTSRKKEEKDRYLRSTGNATAADVSAINAELGSFSKKKG